MTAVEACRRPGTWTSACSPLLAVALLAAASILTQPNPAPPARATAGRSQSEAADRLDEDLSRGKRLFETYCARCHGMGGTGGRGANLKRPVLRHARDDKELFDVIQGGIRGTAMFGNWILSDREIHEVVRYVRSIGSAPPRPLPGDPGKGMTAFTKGDCIKCHMVEGEGESLGPDLTDVGARRGPDFLRQTLVDPGKEKALDARGYTEFLVVVAITTGGRVVTGTRVNEDTFTIQLRDENGQLHSFKKSELEALQKIDGSVMPDYGEILSRGEIDDLISYLAGLQGSP